MSSTHSTRAPASATQRAYLYSCARCISTTAVDERQRLAAVAVAAREHAPTASAIPADAPGTTRAASHPHSAAIRAPDASSSSSIAAHVASTPRAPAARHAPARAPTRRGRCRSRTR